MKFWLLKSKEKRIGQVPVSSKLFFIICLSIGFILSSHNTGAAQNIKNEFIEATEREEKLANSIKEITKEIQIVQTELNRANELITTSDFTLEDTAIQQKALNIEIKKLELELTKSAVAGYVNNDDLTTGANKLSVTEQLRAQSLLGKVQKTRAELISELGILRDEGEFLKLSAARAQEIKERNVVIVKEKLKTLKEKEAAQKVLFDGARQRADDLAKEALASAEVDDEIRKLIQERGYSSATIEGALRWPISSPRITSSYGYRRHPISKRNKLHTGIDVCPSSGTCSGSSIKAAGSGTVFFAGWKNGYGNTVIIDHGSKTMTWYAHLSSISINQGQSVQSLQQIGKVGSTGNVTGAHLHFEVRVNNVPKNPKEFIS